MSSADPTRGRVVRSAALRGGAIGDGAARATALMPDAEAAPSVAGVGLSPHGILAQAARKALVAAGDQHEAAGLIYIGFGELSAEAKALVNEERIELVTLEQLAGLLKSTVQKRA